MEPIRNNGRSVSLPRKQGGVVLLIALIILVAMTLAGIGMMRSIDTGSLIAGNMAFRQATLQAGDAGISKGFNAFVAVTSSGNANDVALLSFNNGQPCANAPGATAAGCNVAGANINFPGYFPTPILACEVTRTCASAADYKWWAVDANWANAVAMTIADPNGGNIATVQYLIHRMCTNAGAPTNGTCLTKRGAGCSQKPNPPPCPTQVLYRITSRSQGTRNTVTYTQTMVLNTENI